MNNLFGLDIPKKTLHILTTLLVCISIMLSCWFTSITVYAEASEEILFDDTNVLDDLRSSDGFNIMNYPFDSTGVIKHPEIENVVEYCYSLRPNMRNNYGLYLYFYNPQGLNISTNSRANKVQIAVEYGTNKDGETVATAYEKFDLQFCSFSTEPNYYRLFYKFKVIDHKSADGKTIVERVNSNARRYDISGIELLTVGNSNATEYKVGGTYIFTGYAQGYGPDINAESNLSCDVDNFETIGIDLSGATDGVDKRTFWRSNTSALGKNHQNQINSVFFAIDKAVLEKYGNKLQKIKAEWWEYKTAPVIVIDNKDIYDRLNAYCGVLIEEEYDRNRGFTIHNRDYTISGDYYRNYQYSWNAQLSSSQSTGAFYYSSDYIDCILPLLFDTNGVSVNDYTLLPETLLEYFETYNKSYYNGHLQFNDKDYSGDLFSANVDNGRTRGYNLREFDIGNPNDYWNISSYDDTHSWWNKLWDYGFGSITNDSYSDIPPIQKVTAQDMTVSDLATHLKINSNDVEKFKDYYKSVSNDCEVFLFRYAVTDYWAEDLDIYDIENQKNYPYDSVGEHNPVVGEVRQGTQFFDFDILEFTFNNDGEYIVIPIVSSPIDHISAYTPSVDPPKNNLWRIIIATILLLLLCILLAPILPHIINAILWVIQGLFKLIAMPFKAIGKAAKKKNGGT